jgi:hypothetical protein
MSTRRQILKAAFRSGAGEHKRCRSGERQQMRNNMNSSIDLYFEELKRNEEESKDVENTEADD